MKKILLSLAVFATSLLGASALEAGMVVLPHRTTFHSLALESQAVVRARLTDVVAKPFIDNNPAHDAALNADVALYRYNNGDESLRRDARLNIVSVLKNDADNSFEEGSFDVVSLQQRSFAQYPESLRNGGEALFFLNKRFDGEWEIVGEARGLLSSEEVGSIADASTLVSDMLSLRTQHSNDTTFNGLAQNRLLEVATASDTRLATDAALEFGWNYLTYAPHFTDAEKALLVDALLESPTGSQLRKELLMAIGRLLPIGAEGHVADMIMNDGSHLINSVATWALEQYGAPLAAQMVLDRYIQTAVTGKRALLVRSIGLLRPGKVGGQFVNRERATDILRDAVANTGSADLRREALIAARDMRLSNGEVDTQLKNIITSYTNGTNNDEEAAKRAIVALAATRTAANQTWLLARKGLNNGRLDKHIEMSVTMPFLVLVDGR